LKSKSSFSHENNKLFRTLFVENHKDSIDDHDGYDGGAIFRIVSDRAVCLAMACFFCHRFFSRFAADFNGRL